MQKNRTISFAWIVACAIASPSLMAATPVPLSPAPAALSRVEAPANTIDKPTQLEKSYYNFEGVPVRSVEPSERHSNVDNSPAAVSKTQAKVTTNAITPLCTTLNTGTAYTLDGTATGGSYCYHFEITQRAKTQVFLTGQNGNTDFALTLIKHEADDTLTSLGTSDQPGNADEGLLALTEPGDYYWSMDANASDGSVFQFGAIVNTNADTNELNDTVGLSTGFPAGQSSLEGNMDSAQDIDYFHYEATDGQDLILRLDDEYGQGEWSAEYFTGTAWVTFAANQFYTFSGLPTPFTLHVRVSPNPSVAVNPAHFFALTVGSQVASSDMSDADTTENIVRIGSSDWSPFLVTQIHNEMNWQLRVLDSNGNPVQGAVVKFRYATDNIPTQTDTAISGATGMASGTVNLPDCSGKYGVTHTSGGNTWFTKFDQGAWDMKVDGANPDEVGVGGQHYPNVTIGHICTQTLQ